MGVRQTFGLFLGPFAFDYNADRLDALAQDRESEWRRIGAADMAYAMQSGRAHRASGDLAFHVLDIMQSLYDAAEKGATVTLSSTCERPAPLPMGLREGTLDE